jgi:hypothetical protein
LIGNLFVRLIHRRNLPPNVPRKSTPPSVVRGPLRSWKISLMDHFVSPVTLSKAISRPRGSETLPVFRPAPGNFYRLNGVGVYEETQGRPGTPLTSIFMAY